MFREGDTHIHTYMYTYIHTHTNDTNNTTNIVHVHIFVHISIHMQYEHITLYTITYMFVQTLTSKVLSVSRIHW